MSEKPLRDRHPGETVDPYASAPHPIQGKAPSDGPTDRQRQLFEQLLRSSAWSEPARFDWRAKADGLTRAEFSGLLTELKAATGAAKAAAKGEAATSREGAADASLEAYRPLTPLAERPTLDPETLGDDGLPF